MVILHPRFARQTLGQVHNQEDLDIRISQSPDDTLTNPQDPLQSKNYNNIAVSLSWTPYIPG